MLTSLLPPEALCPRFVQGESIAQTFEFIASENAGLGFIALSELIVDGRVHAGSRWIVPESLYSPLRQASARSAFA